MANISFPIPAETENQIKEMLTTMARDVIQTVAEKEINSKRYLTLTEACKYVGISYNTLMLWVNQEQLPMIHIQGKKFIDKNTLHEWMRGYEK